MDSLAAVLGEEEAARVASLARAFAEGDADTVKRLHLQAKRGVLHRALEMQEEDVDESLLDDEILLLNDLIERIAMALDYEGHKFLLDEFELLGLEFFHEFKLVRYQNVHFLTIEAIREAPRAEFKRVVHLLASHSASKGFFASWISGFAESVQRCDRVLLENAMGFLLPAIRSEASFHLASCRNDTLLRVIYETTRDWRDFAVRNVEFCKNGFAVFMALTARSGTIERFEVETGMQFDFSVMEKRALCALLEIRPALIRQLDPQELHPQVLLYLLRRCRTATKLWINIHHFVLQCVYSTDPLDDLELICFANPDANLQLLVGAAKSSPRLECALFTHRKLGKKNLSASALRYLKSHPYAIQWRPWTHRYFSKGLHDRVWVALLAVRKLVRPMRERILIRAFRNVPY